MHESKITQNIVNGIENIEIFESPLHGRGLKASRNISVGELVVSEIPIHFLQSVPNKQEVIVCAKCSQFVGSLKTQLALLTGEINRGQDLTELYLNSDYPIITKMISCQNKCGEIYCSEECKNFHFNDCHSILCTGLIPDEDAESHPLFNFKHHAVSTNEIFLLVAEIFAKCCNIYDNNGNIDLVINYLNQYEIYVRNYWWDVVTHSHERNCLNSIEYKGMTKAHETLYISTKAIVKESWEWLNESLHLTEKGLADILSEEYVSR